MNSEHCQDPVSCLNGNCIGCKDGKIWCQDPRCAPYCKGCSIPKNHDLNGTIVVVIILMCLFAMLIIIWAFYGPKIVKRF